MRIKRLLLCDTKKNNFILMKLPWLYIILVLMMCTLSCVTNSEKENYLRKFKFNKALKGEFIGPLNYFLSPSKIAINDSLLIISDNGNKSLLHFYNINNDKTEATYGRKGRGPGEFQVLELNRSIDNKGILWLNDPVLKKVEKFKIDSFLVTDNYTPTKKFLLSPELNIVYNAEPVNDTLIVGTSTNGKGRIFFLNPEKNKFRYKDHFPKVERNFTEKQKGYIYYNWIATKPDKTKIVSALYHIGQIDILDLSGNVLQSMTLGNAESPKMFSDSESKIISDGTTFFYKDIFASDKFIYVLFDGDKNKDDELRYADEIHVFDWEGNPVYLYTLDVPISFFTVDEENKIFYGIRNFENQSIIKFTSL